MGHSYALEGIEDDIRKSLLTGKPYKKVYIESGAANDEIINFELDIHETLRSKDREMTFRTTAAIFPAKINLADYDDIDTEEYNGNLFLHVQ